MPYEYEVITYENKPTKQLKLKDWTSATFILVTDIDSEDTFSDYVRFILWLKYFWKETFG